MDDLQQLYETIADLKRRLSSVVRHGTVHEVRPGKMRINWGDSTESNGGTGGTGGTGGGDGAGGGEPLLSPWIRVSSHHGVVTENVPYKKGQTVMSIANDPDHLTALVFPHSWSDDNPQDGDASNEAHTYRIRKDGSASVSGQSGGAGSGNSESTKSKDDEDDFRVVKTYKNYEIHMGKDIKHVIDREKKTVTITNKNVVKTIGADSEITEIGGVKHVISKDGVDVTGGKLTHNGKQYGSDHIHGGVMPGGGNTAEPSN